MHDVFREVCALRSGPRAGCFGSCIDLEEIEILVLLPFGRLLALLPAAVLEPLCKAAGFIALEAKEIVDKQLSGFARNSPSRSRVSSAAGRLLGNSGRCARYGSSSAGPGSRPLSMPSRPATICDRI